MLANAEQELLFGHQADARDSLLQPLDFPLINSGEPKERKATREKEGDMESKTTATAISKMKNPHCSCP
jgi:hypothetical protein